MRINPYPCPLFQFYYSGRAFPWRASPAIHGDNMTHVVTESCIRCKYTDCVDVCPVDCFKEGPNFLVIDPDECIDCAVCIPECPVNAIYVDVELPDDQKKFLEINAELARVYPALTKRKPALPDAEEWKAVKDKIQYLEKYGACRAGSHPQITLPEGRIGPQFR